MATVHAVRPIAPVHYKEGEKYITRPLKAAQTFKTGAPIIATSTAETVEVAGADPTSGILGFATAGAADYAWKYDTFGHVAPAVPVALANQEFRGSLANSDTGTPEVIADVSAVIGVQYGLVVDSETGYWVLNHDDTTGGVAQVTGLEDGVADGDSDIPVRFVIVASARDAVAA